MVVITVVNTVVDASVLAMSNSPSLSLALRWLMTDNGLSEQELALLAGVSPGAVAAYLGKPHAPTSTWLALLSALRCHLEVKAPKRSLSIALPKIGAQRKAHERHQWEARRLVAFRSQILRQSPGISPADAQRTAQSYVAASATRLDGDLKAAQQRLESTRVEIHVQGMRAALRAVASSAEVNAEDLALLAGVSLSAAQTALDDTVEGRLATPHRLFSAIAARLVIQPAGGGVVSIDLAPSGEWRPEAPRAGRSNMTHDQIRERAQRGEALASIAREAGVSRQRVHAIVRGGP
jgi:transcriptional regulator with XRE-family HTH domain